MNRQALQNRTNPVIFPADALLRSWQALNARLRGLRERWAREDEIEKSIAHLRGLSDEQLRDMGIRRADISRVVRHGPDAR